jgi:hypothetical protein
MNQGENLALNIQAIQPEVMPADSVISIPTEKDLSPRLKDLSWQDAAEFVAEAASAIPFAGPAIKRFMEVGGALGSYSNEERLKSLQWKWLLTQIEEIQGKINVLLKVLPDDERPEPADFAAVVTAIIQVSEKTADFRKRRLLKNALVNAFDVEQYKSGLVLRLIALLQDLEYGDMEVLGKILNAEEAISEENFQEKLEAETPSKPSISEREREQIAKAKLIFSEQDLTVTSMFLHHLDILEKNGLVIVEDYSSQRHLPELARRTISWGEYLLQENLSALSGGQYTRVPQVTEIGKRLVRFVLDRED